MKRRQTVVQYRPHVTNHSNRFLDDVNPRIQDISKIA